MKALIVGAAVAASCLAMSGCAGMPGITGGASTKDFLNQLATCDRDYTLAVGAGVTGGGHVHCSPVVPAGSVIVNAPAGSMIQEPATAAPAATPAAITPAP